MITGWKKIINFGIALLLSALFSIPVGVASPPQCNPSMVTILSIDGGGVRGIIPAVILEKIEQISQEKIANLFDFMFGVSTGTILITFMTTPDDHGNPKYSAEQITKIYKQKADEIFSAKVFHQIITLGGLVGTKYSTEGIINLGNSYFDGVKLSQLLSHVVLFGFDARNKGVVGFSNWEKSDGQMPYYDVKNILSGTIAIMSFFPAKSIYDDKGKIRHEVIDASLVLNNPTALAFLYAQRVCPNANHYLLVSLGTGAYPKVDLEHPQKWGLIHWLPDIIRTTIEGESMTANAMTVRMATLLNVKDDGEGLPKFLVIRINPSVPEDQASPIDPSPSHLDALQKISDQYVEKNQQMLDCLASVLKGHRVDYVDKGCIRLLRQIHTNETFLLRSLEGNL